MKGFFGVLMALLLIAEILPHLWFTDGTDDFSGIRASEQVRQVSLKGERSSDLLNFDSGINYFSDGEGKISVTVMTWDAGNSHGLMDAFGHSPEVCLPVSGGKLLATLPDRMVEVGGKRFKLQRWMFSHPLFEKNIHAYKLAHSSNPVVADLGFERQMVEARLALFRGRQPMPTIEVAIGLVMGTNSPEAAWERIESFLSRNFELQTHSQR